MDVLEQIKMLMSGNGSQPQAQVNPAAEVLKQMMARNGMTPQGDPNGQPMMGSPLPSFDANDRDDQEMLEAEEVQEGPGPKRRYNNGPTPPDNEEVTTEDEIGMVQEAIDAKSPEYMRLKEMMADDPWGDGLGDGLPFHKELMSARERGHITEGQYQSLLQEWQHASGSIDNDADDDTTEEQTMKRGQGYIDTMNKERGKDNRSRKQGGKFGRGMMGPR